MAFTDVRMRSLTVGNQDDRKISTNPIPDTTAVATHGVCQVGCNVAYRGCSAPSRPFANIVRLNCRICVSNVPTVLTMTATIAR